MEGTAYIAMSGLIAAQQRLDVTANNLANADTTGFKAERAAFRALPFFYQGIPNRVDVMAQGNGAVMAQGPVRKTGRSLDAAISGPGFFVVRAPGGQVFYTRAGRFDVLSDGTLVTAGGDTVLGVSGQPILVPPSADVRIAADGTVSVIPGIPNAKTQNAGTVLVVNPPLGSYLPAGNGAFSPVGPVVMVPSATTLTPGALEGSNVNPVGSMIHMIAASRLFQWETQMVKTCAADHASVRAVTVL